MFANLFILLLISINPVSQIDAQKIAERIWQNECGGTIDGLTFWNPNEGFASLGIGHFIWFPQGHKEPFQETFPLLLSFLQSQNVAMPMWLKEAQGCPWSSYEEFKAQKNSSKMIELRQFLYDTRGYQAQFMVQRLEQSLIKMQAGLIPIEKELLESNFSAVAKYENGMYALIDYLNFKGEGLLVSEKYKGKGWGLKDVLLNMSLSEENKLLAFVKSAKELLQQRADNAPKERNEHRWIKGWFKRLDTYAK